MKVGLVAALLEVAEQVHTDLNSRVGGMDPEGVDAKRSISQLAGLTELLTKLEMQEKLLEPFLFKSGTFVIGKISTEFVRDQAKLDVKPLSKAVTILIHPLAAHVLDAS